GLSGASDLLPTPCAGGAGSGRAAGPPSSVPQGECVRAGQPRQWLRHPCSHSSAGAGRPCCPAVAAASPHAPEPGSLWPNNGRRNRLPKPPCTVARWLGTASLASAVASCVVTVCLKDSKPQRRKWPLPNRCRWSYFASESPPDCSFISIDV